MDAASLMVSGNVVLGRYRVVRQLGQGGMGTVHEVEDLDLRRTCAMKVLRSHAYGDGTEYERFMREAEFAAGLDDPHVIRVFDRGELAKGVPYYTMELLRGRSLGATAEIEHRLPWARARHIAIQLCRVLALVHARKIVHRDLKPDNCFLVTVDGDHDFLKLLDFGLARGDSDSGDPRLTATSHVMGTAYYMSPQQARGAKVDHRADVYAVGVILYQLLAGELPFEGINNLQVLEAIKNDTPPLPSYFNPAVPPAVDALIGEAMHKDLALRHQSAEALMAAIEAIPADTAGSRDVAADPYTHRPRVHSPTAMAVTQAAGAAPPTRLPTNPEISAKPPDPVLSAQPAVGRRSWFDRQGRRLAIGLAGASFLASIGITLMFTSSPATQAVSAPSEEPSKPAAPMSEPGDGSGAVTEPADVGSTGLEDPPIAEPESVPIPLPAKPQAWSQKMAATQVKAWRDKLQADPPPACERIKYEQTLEFTGKTARDRLELTGVKIKPHVMSCADALRESFRVRFSMKPVARNVTVSVSFKFPK